MIRPPGQVLVDVDKFTLSSDEIKRLQHPQVAGVILFARNFQDRAQLTELCRSIKAVREEPLLITVDQEGGRVQRFRDNGFTVLPSMRSIGALYDASAAEGTRLAYSVGVVLAAELRACGVDFTFAPVLDLDYAHNHVIGTRAFHIQPQVTAHLAGTLLHGFATMGMKACGKHFPGHGFVRSDSHHETPIDNRSYTEILSSDLSVYQYFSDSVLPAIMPAHIIFQQVDYRTAVSSPFWLKNVLREQLQYNGLVFSDDLSMEGAAHLGDAPARARASLAAGCDVVLVCNHPDKADKVLAGLEHLPSPEVVDKIRRLHPRGSALNWEQLQNDYIYQQALQNVLENSDLGKLTQ